MIKTIMISLFAILYIGSSTATKRELNWNEIEKFLAGYIYQNQHRIIKNNFAKIDRIKLSDRSAKCIVKSSISSGVPYHILNRLAERESGYRYWAVSNPGQRLERQAFGITGVKIYYWGHELHEILPPEIQRKINSSTDSIALYKMYSKQIGYNIEWGARRLKKYYDIYGSWRLSLLAYNTGANSKEMDIAKYDENYLNHHKYVQFVYYGLKDY